MRQGQPVVVSGRVYRASDGEIVAQVESALGPLGEDYASALAAWELEVRASDPRQLHVQLLDLIAAIIE